MKLDRKEYLKEYRLKNKKFLNEKNKDYRLKNKDIIAKEKVLRYKRNKNSDENTRLKRTYNISLEEYNTMLEKQDNCCAICSKNVTLLTSKLAVDHNHKTNETRGLLCINCNTALGGFKDDIIIIEKALNYLKYYNG